MRWSTTTPMRSTIIKFAAAWRHWRRCHQSRLRQSRFRYLSQQHHVQIPDYHRSSWSLRHQMQMAQYAECHSRLDIPPAAFFLLASTMHPFLCRASISRRSAQCKTICTPDNSGGCVYTFVDCKVNAAVTLATNPTQPNGGRVHFMRCDSGAHTYQTAKYDYFGTQSTETTIVCTGRRHRWLSPPISWKLVTTANTGFVIPFNGEAPTHLEFNGWLQRYFDAVRHLGRRCGSKQ